MGGVENGYGLKQEPERSTRIDGIPDLPEGFKVVENGDDARYASDGSDSDAGDSDSAPGPSAPGPSTRVTPKFAPTGTIEDEYPVLFLPLTRESNEKIFDDRSLRTMSYPWKNNTVDISSEQFVQMKATLSNEISRHFIAFGTSRGIPWAIKTQFPWLDCSTKIFQALRQYGNHHNHHLKHDFVYEKLYTYLYRTWLKNPDMANLTNDELFRFLGAQFNQDLVKRLWAKSIRVLDVEKTFANRKKLGPWWLRQVFLNTSIRVLPLMYSEVASNSKLKWQARAPSGWVGDADRRGDINWFFECLSIAPEFNEVELDDFEWVPLQTVPLTNNRARGTISRTEARLIGADSPDR